jgi:UDP-N-acetyl-D-glucosamine dehydrogenase
MQEIFKKIADRTALVGVVGQGYVGLPLSLVFCEAGFNVTGFDVDQAKVNAINGGESFIRHIGAERVATAVASGRFRVTADFMRLRACDAILICVPTPLGPHREPDNSFIHATAREIAKRLRYGQLVVLESTTYPGTTDTEVRAILEESGLHCTSEFLLAFSPEREDPGRKDFTTKSIPKVVGGVDPRSTEAAAALYGAAMERIVPVANARVAESAKLLENIFRSVNIALVNELKVIFDRMGIDVWEVIEAAKTKPFGFMPFYPGPGLGALHPARSLLPLLEGRGARPLGAVHRAGRRDQHADAGVRRRQGRRGPERRQETAEGIEGARPRALVQGQHRRRP